MRRLSYALLLFALLLAPNSYFSRTAQGTYIHHLDSMAHSSAQVRLWASPETPWVKPGEIVTFALLAEGGVKVSGAEVTLDYGPDVELLEVKAGPYLGKDTIAAPPLAGEAQATYAWARIGETPEQALAGELALVTVTATQGRPWNSWVRARVRLVDDSFQKFQETTLFIDLHVNDSPPSPIPVWPSAQSGSGNSKTRCCRSATDQLQFASDGDANDLLVYPRGEGLQSYVAGDQTITYAIRFENPADALTPATDVTVIAQLDPIMDPGSVLVGNSSHPEVMSVVVDPSTHTINWTFNGINLPPNQESPEGEGWVEFSVDFLEDVPSGTTARVSAAVRLDSGLPTETNEVVHTLDSAAPSTQVSPLSTVQLAPDFQVSWVGDDNAGSGVQRVALLAAKNGGPYEVVGATSGSSLAFRGEMGATYNLATVGVDRVGNIEAIPEKPDATITVGQRLSYERGLHLLGIPVVPGEGSKDLLAAPGSIWSVWDAATQTYTSQTGASGLAALTRVEPGHGLWAQFEEGTTFLLTGQPVPADQPYSISLHAGWNLIASPFTEPVPWSLDNIRVSADGSEQTLREAQELGWMEDFAWGWEGDAYTLVYDSGVGPGASSFLEPFQGYWVQAHRDLTLMLPPPLYED